MQTQRVYLLTIFDIFAKGVNTTPGTSNFVHFKGSSTASITVPATQTITINSFVTANPSSYAIPQWRIENSTLVQNPDFLDTATNSLANYGIQIPNAVIGAKYSYWYGTEVGISNYTSSSNTLGRTSFNASFSTTIVFNRPPLPSITVTWSILSNGDVKVKAT